MYGLGSHESRVLETLPPTLRRLVEDELSDPESAPDMEELLRSKNPTKTIAREVSQAITEEAYAPASGLGYDDDWNGLGGLGGLKKKFKKLRKKVSKVRKKIAAPIKKIAKKVLEKKKEIAKKIGRPVRKVAKSTGQAVKRAAKKVGKPIVKFGKKYGALIVTALGIVLAPFTAGASLAVAAAIAAGISYYQKRKAAEEAKRLGKKEAAAMAAEVKRQEAEVHKQADAVYAESQEHFLAIGLTPDKWARLTVDQKIQVIEYLSKGEVPPGYQITASAREEAAQAAAADAAQETSDAVQEAADQELTQAEAEEAIFPGEEEGPAGNYEIYIEGELAGTTATADEMAALVSQKSSIGDRVEVFLNGQSTGLKLRTAGGLISVPPGEEGKVRAMSHEELVAIVERATGRAKPGGGFPWGLLLAVPVVVAVAS